MREISYKAIILKKTPYGEADEIITALCLRLGKTRFLAKSVKLAKSKLQNNLQSLFVCNLRTTSAVTYRMGKIIGSEPIEVFSKLRENLLAVKSAFAASELAIKFLPDEQPYDSVFNLLNAFLNFLDKTPITENNAEIGLLAFKIKFLELIGLGIRMPVNIADKTINFDPGLGGFVSEGQVGIKTPKVNVERFKLLKQVSFKDLPSGSEDFKELKILIDGFLEHHLERELKAEKSMNGVV